MQHCTSPAAAAAAPVAAAAAPVAAAAAAAVAEGSPNGSEKQHSICNRLRA